MITTIKLINIPTASHNYLFFSWSDTRDLFSKQNLSTEILNYSHHNVYEVSRTFILYLKVCTL